MARVTSLRRRRAGFALGAAAIVATGALAGARQAQQAVVLKGRAPVSTEMLKIKLPRPAEADLANGLHLMVLEDRKLPQVTFQLLIRGAGGYDDPAELPGLASMTAAMMREGTTTLNTQQIAEKLETMAASVNVSTGASSPTAAISGSSLTENFKETLSLAADILLHPTFPQEELDRYKTRTRAGLVQQRANPGFLANERFNQAIYGNHPAARLTTTAAALDAVTRDRLVAFHREKYVPDHAVLAIAGDMSLAEARTLAESLLGSWKKAGAAMPKTTDPAPIGPAAVSLVVRPNSVQTSLWVGTQMVSRTAPDYDVVNVMNAVLGGGPTGRLFTHLREEKGYTYGAYSNVLAAPYRGAWLASMDVRTDVTQPALKDLMAEIARMRDELVPEKEFEDRKRGMVASFALSLESPSAVLGNHITRWLYNLPVDYWDKYAERTMAVTREQVQASAKKYLDPARLQIVAVGDATKVADILKSFGTVQQYDTNGNKIGG
ncbi:MAG TPA: pitrilysin family protein [Vicinamibacterales bacterium]|nr:pitrilysin family protein [Vicinamibacterales bacterium]